MSKHYGITCHKCGEPIVLANIESEGPIDITFYTVPTEPHRCPFCKHIGLYGPKDGHFFRLEVTTPTDTAPDLT